MVRACYWQRVCPSFPGRAKGRRSGGYKRRGTPDEATQQLRNTFRMRAVVLLLIGACAVLADRNLGNFTPGRPINHGVPGVSTFGGVPSFQRPQVDPRPPGRGRRSPDSPIPPKGQLTRPRPRPGRSAEPDPEPTSPQHPSFQRPQTLPGTLPSHHTRPFSRPQRSADPTSPQHPSFQTRPNPRPQTLPGHLTRPFSRPQRSADPTSPQHPNFQTRPNPRPQTLPAHLTRPLARPQRSPHSPTPPPGYQPKPQVQPTPPPGHQPVQTLPARLPEDKTADLPPKVDLLKPADRPQVDPIPSPADLTKPAPRPQTLPATVP